MRRRLQKHVGKHASESLRRHKQRLRTLFYKTHTILKCVLFQFNTTLFFQRTATLSNSPTKNVFAGNFPPRPKIRVPPSPLSCTGGQLNKSVKTNKHESCKEKTVTIIHNDMIGYRDNPTLATEDIRINN